MKLTVIIGIILGILSAFIGVMFPFLSSHENGFKKNQILILTIELLTGSLGVIIYIRILKGNGQFVSLAIGGILILISFILFIIGIA